MMHAPTDRNGKDIMTKTKELSEARRALLERYLRGNPPETAKPMNPILQRYSGSPPPLSFGQQQMWLLAQLLPDIPVYTECVTIHLPGLLNVSAFELSFNEFIKRHEAWRTSFPTVDGQPIQMIHSPLWLPLPVADLRGLPEAEREAEAIRLATEDAQKPFDLANGPLLRAMLMHLSDVDHRLFLTLHHIIFDGVAVYQVLLPELYALYEAFSSGKESSLPPLPIQYADYAIWQRERLEREGFANQLAYWRKQLAEAPMTLELPTDRPHPAIPTYRGAMHPFALSRHVTDALKTLSRQEGVTLYMTLVAAFNTLLYRYTGQEDILLGTAISDRKDPAVQGLMGYFLNTLVLRTDLSGNLTFRELLGRVREITLEALAHQEVPFEYLVKELKPERNSSQNPLFQVMLSFQPPLPVLPSGWTLTQMDVEIGTAKFDLSLELDDRQAGLIGRFVYSTDLFDSATIQRMVVHWKTLLEGIVADSTKRLTELPLLTEMELQQLLVTWNATSTVFPEDKCIHQLFEEQAERTPEAIAVVYEDQQLTYRELNVRANQLAHYLRQLGVGPEIPVGLYIERSLDMVVGLLGVLKAGGAYVPLDPTYPKDRLAFLLQDTQMSVLLTQERLLRGLPEHTARVICLDAEWEAIAQENSENVISEVMANNLASIIYTSGSTGRPKGVLVTHQNLVHSTIARTTYYKEPVNSFLLLSSFAFDSSVAGIFWTLCQGGLLVLPRAGFQMEISHLAELIAQNHVSHLLSLPSLYMLLLEQAKPQYLISLRTVIVAGESCMRELVERHYRLLSQTHLFNEYGPTEGTVWSSVYRCESQNLRSAVPIGQPIANTQIYLLDTHLQLVPIGVAGELYIGGAGVTRGYLNQPELTVKRFIPNPFSNESGTRLYKTGDLARYLPDGNIEFLGRNDHQVKIRGFRIELGEIETVLKLHPIVREAVVMAREDAFGDKRLVAYVVQNSQYQDPDELKEGIPMLVSQLRSLVKERLPNYMIPASFVLLEAMPLTPNGKVDQRALPAPEPSRHTSEETYFAPILLVHQQLVQIWEDLLDVRPIGIKDDFFALGGHSLLAIRLIDRIAQVCGKKLPPSTLFAGATIEHLATALMGEVKTDSRAPLVTVQVGRSRQPFFYLHGEWRGGALYCSELARHLGPDQPFYLLEPYKFDGLAVPPPLEAIAAAHLKSLRAVQPEGPYLLGGYCNGGLVAYEMARQLHAQGQAVDLLVLMDPDTPARHRWVRSVISRFGNLLWINQDKQFEWFLYLQHIYRYLRFSHHRGLKNSELLETVEQAERGYRLSKGGFTTLRPRLKALFPKVEILRQDYPNVYDWVASDYTPDLYPGKITFFWTSEEPSRPVGWQNIVKAKEAQVEIHTIPGNHLTGRTEHLHVLAEHLRDCVNRLQEPTLT